MNTAEILAAQSITKNPPTLIPELVENIASHRHQLNTSICNSANLLQISQSENCYLQHKDVT